MATKNEVTENAVNTAEEVLDEVTTQVATTDEFNWKGAGIIIGVGALIVGVGVMIYKKVKESKASKEEVPAEEATVVEAVTEEPETAQA